MAMTFKQLVLLQLVGGSSVHMLVVFSDKRKNIQLAKTT